MVDSAVSYEVIGTDAAPLSLEARSGVRYQRTAIQGELEAAGIMVQTPELVDSAADLVVGARAVVRPTHWLQLAGVFDVGVIGDSDSTWSAALDASVHVSSRLLLTAGWRSLTTHRSSVNITMQGPRMALQFLF
jgi:hypothetical protein